jgi:CRP-like cAMP-binding protein
LVRHGRQGEEVVLHDARPGEFLAEASLDSARYHCGAVAPQPSVVLRATKADFQRLLADDPDFARSWMALLAAQLRTARARALLRNTSHRMVYIRILYYAYTLYILTKLF